MHRVFVLPVSIAAAYLATLLFPLSRILGRSAGRAAAPDGLRDGLEQQVRRGRTGVLVAGAALAQVAGAAFSGDQGDGRLHALAGGLRRPPERAGDIRVVAGLPEDLERRAERVEHRLVARLGLAALDHALDARVERRREPGQVEVGL